MEFWTKDVWVEHDKQDHIWKVHLWALFLHKLLGNKLWGLHLDWNAWWNICWPIHKLPKIHLNPTSCSSTSRLHLVYGATWGEGKYNPSLKKIFFWFDNVFLLSKTNLDRRSQTHKRLRYVTSIILGMYTDAARNRLLNNGSQFLWFDRVCKICFVGSWPK